MCNICRWWWLWKWGSSLSVFPRQHSKWYVWSNSPLCIACQFDVKLTSLCFVYQLDVKLTYVGFGVCLFVLNRTILIFYTDLTIYIVHLRLPHMCVYPLAKYVCLSTRHICVFIHSPHIGVYPLATYVCLSARHICVHVPSQDLDF